MAGFNQPNILNPILGDVSAINEILVALSKLDPSTLEGIKNQTKRLVETPSGWAFEQFNGTTWVKMADFDVNAQSVDGYSAATGTTAGTIPVRDASGKIEGDITGNAATATSADALSAVNPVAMGGTGASTAAQARSNLGVPPTSHASSGTTYGVSTATKYGHAKASGTTPKADADGGSVGAETTSFARGDHAHAKVYGSPTTAGDVFVTDSANVSNTAEKHYAVSPKALAEVKSAAEEAQDSANKCLPLTGGTMTGAITSNNIDQVLITNPDAGIGDTSRSSSLYNKPITVFDKDGKRGGAIEVSWNSDGSRSICFSIRNRKDSAYPNAGLFESKEGYIAFQCSGSQALLPAGAVFAFAANSAPSGCILCNGAAVSRTTYAALFAAIGTTYGSGDGSTTFNLPDLTDKFIQGSATAGTVKSAGLPEIYGGFDSTSDSSAMFGNAWDAFRLGTPSGARKVGSTWASDVVHNVSFNASKYNPIYGASTTVQPPALTMCYYIKY